MDVSVEVPAQVDWGGQMAYLIGWGSPFDADDHTYKVFGTDKGANYSGYSNELVDQYLTEARQSDDPKLFALRRMINSRKSWRRILRLHLSAILMPIMWQNHQSRELMQIPLWDITVLESSGILRTGRLRSKKQKWTNY